MADKSRSNNRSNAADDAERMEDEGAAGTAVDPAPALADEIVELRKDRDNLQDRLLRQAAEFDNYRKRIERERRELSEFASADILQDILPIVDDFERALKVDAPGSEPYRQGLEIIHRGLQELLRKRGVTAVDAVGADFDPHIHQAVSYEEAPDRRDGEVIAEFRRGYRLGDRLLRPAMVKVAKA
ncbi:MAG TPA: nucleotide exchange factor GrpE [Vicinamibacterales bacterium]|jgi:molecular chaperone GrpE|nr:nucleotide exchange factor GrpE [Vicinamibacterales bacterium]